MADKDTFDELSLLIRARYALIVLDTREYDRAIAGIERISAELGLHLYTWSRSRGTVRGSHFTDPLVDDTADPARALAFIRDQGAGLFVFRQLAAHFDEPTVISSILDGVDYFSARKGAIIVVGQDVRLPDALHRTPRCSYSRRRRSTTTAACSNA